MDITTPHYTGFNATTLEGLSVQLLRKIVEFQKDSIKNTQNVDIVSFDVDELNETLDAELLLEASLVDGELRMRDYFPGSGFTSEGSVYPFNSSNICDAAFHVLSLQQKLELNLQKNSAKAQFISFSIEGETEIGNSNQFMITITLEDLPISVTNSASGTITNAKPYLLN